MGVVSLSEKYHCDYVYMCICVSLYLYVCVYACVYVYVEMVQKALVTINISQYSAPSPPRTPSSDVLNGPPL